MNEVRFDAQGKPLRRFRIRVSGWIDGDLAKTRFDVSGEDCERYEGRIRVYTHVPLHALRPPRPERLDPHALVGQESRDWSTSLVGARSTPAALPPKAVRDLRVTDVGHDVLADILDHYFADTPADAMDAIFAQARTKNERGTYFGYELRRDGPMAERGTARVSYDAYGDVYSYGWRIAAQARDVRGERVYLINGDGGPTKASRAHQALLRGYVEREGWGEDGADGVATRRVECLRPHAIVPFSVLAAARVTLLDLVVLDMTPARVVRREVPCTRRGCTDGTGAPHTHTAWDHFLGETLLKDRRTGNVYLSGLDRNDDARKRSFYMALVCTGAARKKPMSVEAAINYLRPEGLPADTPRQGEWFFVPEPGYRPSGDALRTPYCAVVSDDAARQLDLMHRYETGGRTVYRVPGRETRHVASSLVVNGAVYARGVVTDAEHTRLRLGKTWHRVVKNRALEGWRYDPAAMRATVD